MHHSAASFPRGPGVNNGMYRLMADAPDSPKHALAVPRAPRHYPRELPPSLASRSTCGRSWSPMRRSPLSKTSFLATTRAFALLR